jgi:hypothetical protein
MDFKKLLLFLFLAENIFCQNNYFPDANWQTKKPNEVKMNAALLDSAVQFAIQNEIKMEYDLRLANLKAYAREPQYTIRGPMKHRGKPAGLILKMAISSRNGAMLSVWI